MILSATSLHALRAVSLLASRPGEAAMGRDLARALRVPSDYLSKVLARLARAGVLEARRGRSGGYRLARPPGEIRVGEVVRPLEGARARPGCLLRPRRRCPETGTCAAHGSWSGVSAAYQAFLDETTVADLGGGAAAAPAGGARAARSRSR